SSLAGAKNGWRYKQHLMSLFPIGDFWKSIPATIQIFYHGAYQLLSVGELSSFDEIVTIMKISEHAADTEKEAVDIEQIIGGLDGDAPIVNLPMYYWLSQYSIRSVFEDKNVIEARRILNDYLIINWSKDAAGIAPLFPYKSMKAFPISLSDSNLIGFMSPKFINHMYDREILLNTENALVQWLERIQIACLNEQYGLKEESFSATLVKIFQNFSYFPYMEIDELQNYLSAWREIPNLPEELYPPEIELTPEMFWRRKGD
ncbi:MAG TPA: hypothetical protein VF599_03265, partial [Pyrinomonadaceae bacterium]